MMERSASLYSKPLFQEDAFQGHYERWKDAVGDDTLQEEEIMEEKMKKSCQLICTHFPRGSKCGSLLWEPVVDNNNDTPLEHRGVSMQWLVQVYWWMRKLLQKEGLILPTRLFVAFFVEPLVLQKQPTQRALPLYYFVPVEFRGPPQVFLSHGWDSWLRQLLHWPRGTTPGKLAMKNSIEKTFLWLDIFANVQDPGSEKQQSEVAQIGQVVRFIGETCIVVPGHGSVPFALLPARRSWCCLEMAYSHHLSARVGLNKASFYVGVGSVQDQSFHQSLVCKIGQLKCTDAETSCENEKKAIQDLLDREVGLEHVDRLVRKTILKAFYERYRSNVTDAIASPYGEALERLQEEKIL